MNVAFNLAADLDAALLAVASAAGLEASGFNPEVRTADARHGDYQANGVLGYAKARKLNPRGIAEKLVAALPASVTDSYAVTIAGPGFINFTAKPSLLVGWLRTFDTASHLRSGAGTAKSGQTWVVDYSSPNTAKQMHVGHLRSMVIGEAICRLLEFNGAKVVRDNHIGDWGTGFGMLIWAYKRHLDPVRLAADPLEEFERLYTLGQSAAKADPAVLDESRQELVKLQSGDADNLAIWKKINDATLQAFQQIYDRLGIKFDVTLGESFYRDQVDRVYRELTDVGLAQESQGALVVFHPEHPRFKTQPFIMRKGDGASNYATTDLATALYRLEHFHADGIVVVTDFRQADHFEQLYLTVRKWFAAKNYRLPELQHVTFGTVTGEDGKALRTRDGGIIKLKDLLAEAEARALALVNERSSDIPAEEKTAIAGVVGLASVQYADPLERLRLRVGQDDFARGQYCRLPALCWRAHPLDLSQARRHAGRCRHGSRRQPAGNAGRARPGAQAGEVRRRHPPRDRHPAPAFSQPVSLRAGGRIQRILRRRQGRGRRSRCPRAAPAALCPHAAHPRDRAESPRAAHADAHVGATSWQ